MKERWETIQCSHLRLLAAFGCHVCVEIILGEPGADKGGEGKSKRVEKYIWNEEK